MSLGKYLLKDCSTFTLTVILLGLLTVQMKALQSLKCQELLVQKHHFRISNPATYSCSNNEGEQPDPFNFQNILQHSRLSNEHCTLRGHMLSSTILQTVMQPHTTEKYTMNTKPNFKEGPETL
jgi:hypothetical protein